MKEKLCNVTQCLSNLAMSLSGPVHEGYDKKREVNYISFQSDPQHSDYLGLENAEENNDLYDALQKSLKEIEESMVLVEKKL